MAAAVGLHIRDRSVAEAVYASMCNTEWKNADGAVFLATWRASGDIVAGMRACGEDYMDFYCSGNEGHITAEISRFMAEFGWTHFALDPKTADVKNLRTA